MNDLGVKSMAMVGTVSILEWMDWSQVKVVGSERGCCRLAGCLLRAAFALNFNLSFDRGFLSTRCHGGRQRLRICEISNDWSSYC